MSRQQVETVKVREVILGEGKPKVCVPIVGRTKEKIFEEVWKIKKLPIDLVEWRVDWYEESKDIEKVTGVAAMLREVLGAMPILFTIRTSGEGGETSYTPQEYVKINIGAAQSEYIDMIDIELLMGDEIVQEIIENVHKEEKVVIVSNHDFSETPSKDEIVRRMMKMDELGADILKVAVMPQSTKDVITLLDATREMAEEKTVKPVVTMSMGPLGVISRVAGSAFGSAMTFGSGECASAPGQIEARELSRILESL